MGLGDRIRGFFAGKNNPAFVELATWASTRKGIEGYIEPQTPTNPTTLLLVDRNGEHIRGPVREPADAVSFCERRGFPVYDAQVIGYPKRMKEFEKRRRAGAADSLDDDIADLERRLTEQ
ncbi:MAG: oxidoreductase [Actinomycetota bacterium]|nr:oxidoreductase [Actinomycetota bacterium]